MDRIAELSDIRRAASLQDIRLEVTVAHTNNRLRARFCVAMRRPRGRNWAVGVDIKQVKHTETQLIRLAKSHKGAKCSCRAPHNEGSSSNGSHSHGRRHSHCAMCAQVREEVKQWQKFPAFSTVGKRHLDDKCARITRFLYQLFRLLSLNAQWLQSCELLREMLRLTESLCRVQYEDDSVAVGVIQSLKRVTPLTAKKPIEVDSHSQPNDNDDCSICLSSLFEPAEIMPTTTNGDTAGLLDALTSQPTQGVELPCGHRFHDSCICVWFHTRLNCPVCRQDSTDETK